MTSTAIVRILADDVTWGISPGYRFCVSRKGGTWGGGCVHLKGKNGIVQPWAGNRKPLLGTGWAVCLVFCMNGRRKQPCHLVGPPFQAPMALLVLEHVGIAHANTR